MKYSTFMPVFAQSIYLFPNGILCLFTVDEEFEVVATQVLKRTHAMVNKYRRLLMVEAEVGTHTSKRSHACMCYM